jgi:hypothetical protein
LRDIPAFHYFVFPLLHRQYYNWEKSLGQVLD